jgi:hypothetical protein
MIPKKKNDDETEDSMETDDETEMETDDESEKTDD